jgi:hypothetical protein
LATLLVHACTAGHPVRVEHAVMVMAVVMMMVAMAGERRTGEEDD